MYCHHMACVVYLEKGEAIRFSEHASSCTPIDYTLVSLASKNAMHLCVFVCAVEEKQS